VIGDCGLDGCRVFKVRELGWYDYGMKIRITDLDIRAAKAHLEFMEIADSDIQSAHGQATERRVPSEAVLAVYDEVVRQQEAQSEAECELE